MAITIGQQLGSYEIVSQIGSGGMGEVYKARDIRLNRTGVRELSRTCGERGIATLVRKTIRGLYIVLIVLCSSKPSQQ